MRIIWISLFVVGVAVLAHFAGRWDKERAKEQILVGRELSTIDNFIDRLQKYSDCIQSRWTAKELIKTSDIVEKISRQFGISVNSIIAVLEAESELNPRAYHKNRNGTVDRGISQQNSDYYQRRCFREFRRRCAVRELYRPSISVALMRQRFIECKKYSGVRLILCYHSNKQARKKDLSESKYLKRWRKYL